MLSCPATAASIARDVWLNLIPLNRESSPPKKIATELEREIDGGAAAAAVAQRHARIAFLQATPSE
ncbi:hypothetical protein CUJ84_pRLN5000105 (plasmid) [Rhizobium leguminosarum]|uniref:Uncharacterized protein n=1 Tax=Rhizobium leguminosarum TaxID=384 RepID=A0A2K9ZIP0_RHILE|nr:hypothetical protein CUJ84_pRLN5000105 [Rhizobium leguminosarum]